MPLFSAAAIQPFHQLTKAADALVRVVALVVVALALALPLMVILLVAAFKADARDYVAMVLERMIELFRTILKTEGGDRAPVAAQPQAAPVTPPLTVGSPAPE